MKRALFVFILAVIVIASSAFGQAQRDQKQPKKETRREEPQKKEGTGSIPTGFGNLQWGASLSESKEKVLGKITFIDEKRVIMTRDGNIEYVYGFFHPDPALISEKQGKEAARPADAKQKVQAQEQAPAAQAGEPKLYYVMIKFPYLTMDDVRNKIQERYGAPNGESIKNNQGALIWDSQKTTIIMWVDSFEKKPFSRKITYIGKDLAREVNEYQKQIFNKNEIEILRTLNP